MKYLVLTLFLLTSCASLNVKSEVEEKMISVCETEPIKHCFHKWRGSKVTDSYILNFHGAGSSERDLLESMRSPGFIDLKFVERSFKNYQSMQTKLGVNHPPVLTPSFDKLWLFTNEDKRYTRPQGATVKNFMENILPALEKKYGLEGKKRILYGISQGGFNAMQLFFRYPTKWVKALFINPLNPLCSPIGIQSNCLFNIAGWSNFLYISANYTNEKMWEEAAPMALLKRADKAKLPPFLYTVGKNDQFKFYDRGKDFMGYAEIHGYPITAIPHDGDHGDFPVDAMVEFITTKGKK